ncbi:hypothetical protein Rcas_1206 [Roseiflexus castenholzii DSM 13941]|uniref:Uncharacterized protein n=1 Tax=Roseiflexus castenholzii (strain DSM 13941 / HLO8) TaxID=383372 RepID=A7NIK3_ROSCS|nr:hypothetical protein Rcas_1206 [Roseiflexus castenholzii DSM 13941]
MPPRRAAACKRSSKTIRRRVTQMERSERLPIQRHGAAPAPRSRVLFPSASYQECPAYSKPAAQGGSIAATLPLACFEHQTAQTLHFAQRKIFPAVPERVGVRNAQASGCSTRFSPLKHVP